jgi:REP element-mobilizing transposase RayT
LLFEVRTVEQLELFDYKTNKPVFPKLKLCHGGLSQRGKRKEKRTIIPNKWIHLCLKSSKAIGHLSFWHKDKRDKIQNLIKRKSRQHFVELKEAVNMGNHIHMKIRVKHPVYFRAFLRSITGMIARIMTGAKRGNKFGKFWDALAFTRVLTTNFEVRQLEGYFKANRIEREKGYLARLDMLKSFNNWLYGLKKSKQAKIRQDRLE